MPATPLVRPPTTVLPPTQQTPSFVLGAANRSYKHQYANIYFARLQLLRKYVLARARRRWKDVSGACCDYYCGCGARTLTSRAWKATPSSCPACSRWSRENCATSSAPSTWTCRSSPTSSKTSRATYVPSPLLCSSSRSTFSEIALPPRATTPKKILQP